VIIAKKKILLVDDVQLFLEQQKTFFDRSGFELILARNGNEALDVLKEVVPDLIFMDLYMPGMDGDKCCCLIKSSEALRDIPVIMVTSGVDQGDFKKCWQAGCDDIILKPINPLYFYAIVEKYLPLTVRKAPRFIVRMRVQYGPDQETLLDNYSLNMSTGGLFIVTVALLPAGTRLALAFILPNDEKSIQCEGKVAWVNHPEHIKNQSLPVGMGVQFVNLSLDDMNCIREFIKNGTLSPFW